jgi:hypothetical protein
MDERTLELKTMIEEKNDELLKEIAHALSNNDYKSYNYLKSLQLQCKAEIRLLKHLDSTDDNKEFIIC